MVRLAVMNETVADVGSWPTSTTLGCLLHHQVYRTIWGMVWPCSTHFPKAPLNIIKGYVRDTQHPGKVQEGRVMNDHPEERGFVTFKIRDYLLHHFVKLIQIHGIAPTAAQAERVINEQQRRLCKLLIIDT